jgi:hypothetical protein
MRISWLSAEEIAAARAALRAEGATWDDHFAPEFASPAEPPDARLLDWEHITEHVARAERVSEIVREQGLAAARARFSSSNVAIEAATLAAAAHEDDALGFDEVAHVLSCEIDSYVFYAPFLELMIRLGREDLPRTVRTYEDFVAAYERALVQIPHGNKRIAAVRDGLADFYVSAGMIDAAEALFEKRHEEDPGDVAVALTASRAFLAAGSISHAVRWLGIGAARARVLGRDALATKLSDKQQAVRRRLS